MGAIKKSVQIRKLWRSCQTQLELSKIFRFWSRATRDFEQQTIFLVVLRQQKIWRQLNSNEWHLNLRLFPQNLERNFFEQIVPLQTLDIQKIYLCRAASRDPIFQLWKWNLLTKNTEFHIRTNVFSITDLYLRDFFLKGFHDSFDGDSPLISGNTEFAMKFRCPWRSINWSFCYFHSLLLCCGIRDTCVARVATRTKLVQTPGKSLSLWACEHRQGGGMGDGEKSWERRCQFPFSGIPWGCLTKISWITETWIYEHSIEKVTSNWTNVTSISVQMFQQLSSEESLCYLLFIADYTVYPVI